MAIVENQHDFCFVPFRTLIRTYLEKDHLLGRTGVVKQASIFFTTRWYSFVGTTSGLLWERERERDRGWRKGQSYTV